MGHSAKDLKPGPRKCQIPISTERILATNFGEIEPARGSPFLREEMSGLLHSQSDTVYPTGEISRAKCKILVRVRQVFRYLQCGTYAILPEVCVTSSLEAGCCQETLHHQSGISRRTCLSKDDGSRALLRQ